MKESSHFAVGRSLPRIDIIEKVMGEARYSNDAMVMDALSLAIVGSPRPRIRIRSLDVSAALQVPGVLAVLTAHDIPGKNRLPWGNQPFLVEGEARYYGEPIALVIAEHPSDAREGARQVHIEYDELPALLKLDDALHEDAPTLTTGPEGHNIWARVQREEGDVDAALAQSEQMIQRSFETSAQAAASIEPPSLSAQISSDGGVYVSGSIEAPHAVQAAIAALLDLPYHRIYITQNTLGGGTGSKAESAAILAGYTALATWLTGRPTQLVLSSEEEFRLAVLRPPTRIHMKYGVSREGELQACEVHAQFQAGAYLGFVEMALHRAVAHAIGPYSIPHIRVTAEAIATHTTPYGLLMGYGQMPISFAQECLLDELAQRLNLDPIALRRQNMVGPQRALPWHPHADPSCQLEAALSQVLEQSGWDEKRGSYSQPSQESPEEGWGRRRTRRGIGVALSYAGIGIGGETPTPPRATVSIRLQGDGSIQVSIPQAKTGVGTRTLLAQIVAESLAVSYNAVHLLEVDTRHDAGGPLHPLAPSLWLTGQALLDAAEPLRAQLLQVASAHFQCQPAQIVSRPDQLLSPDEEQSLSFAEAIALCWRAGLPTSSYGHASFPPRAEASGFEYPAYTYAAHVAEIEIDLDTYLVDVLALYAVCDVGKTINPNQAKTEIQSKLLYGLGFSLLEELLHDEGIVLNGPLLAYPITSFEDLPELHPILLEAPFEGGPYGCKGLTDLPAVGVVPAILNAISHALGRRVFELPATPERLFSTAPPQS